MQTQQTQVREHHRIAIRPLSAATARPGDDLLLTYSIRIPGTTTSLLADDTSIVTPESDYIAVYDKKMLWRANLYIAETTNDWNDVHPWNVPASGTA